MAKLSMGELESRVMDVVWDRGGWLTPGDVHEALSADRPIAYTTAMTVLVRLWRKGRLQRRRRGRAYAYHATVSREEFAAGRMRELLGDAHDRPAALSHFIASLRPKDRDQLRRLLQSKKGR